MSEVRLDVEGCFDKLALWGDKGFEIDCAAVAPLGDNTLAGAFAGALAESQNKSLPELFSTRNPLDPSVYSPVTNDDAGTHHAGTNSSAAAAAAAVDYNHSAQENFDA